MIIDDQTIQRFYSFIEKGASCWEWKGSHSWKGYGQFCLNSKTTAAHRVSYLIHYGDIPDGYCVCHHCDNPGCVRPSHLFAANQSDNIRDAIQKGRFVPKFKRGEKSINAKLTRIQVRAIRQEYATGNITQRELSTKYKINQGAISRIINRKRWNHI